MAALQPAGFFMTCRAVDHVATRGEFGWQFVANTARTCPTVISVCRRLKQSGSRLEHKTHSSLSAAIGGGDCCSASYMCRNAFVRWIPALEHKLVHRRSAQRGAYDAVRGLDTEYLCCLPKWDVDCRGDRVAARCDAALNRGTCLDS
jgi:hypothetical protein